MKISRNFKRILGVGTLALAMVALPGRAYAHCDTMDGPVVKAAQQALATKQLEPMLIWVRAQDEPEIRHAFEHTLKVRAINKDAATLADRFFFETVVRIHREGEGEPYTGLKPAGTDIGHAVPAADHALETGQVAELRRTLHAMVDARLDEYFADAAKKRAFRPTDVAAGREYVAAYVRLQHFGEELEALASGHAHHAPAAGAAAHAH
jgi:hypothetical protein